MFPSNASRRGLLAVAVLLVLVAGAGLVAGVFWMEAATLEAQRAWHERAEDLAEAGTVGETVALGFLGAGGSAGGAAPDPTRTLLDAIAPASAIYAWNRGASAPFDPLDTSGTTSTFAVPGWGARLARAVGDELVAVRPLVEVRVERAAIGPGSRPFACRVDIQPLAVPLAAWDLVAHGPDPGTWSWPTAWSAPGVRRMRAGTERGVAVALLDNVVAGPGCGSWLQPAAWPAWRALPGAVVQDLDAAPVDACLEPLGVDRWRVDWSALAGRTLVLEDRTGGVRLELVATPGGAPARLVVFNRTLAPTRLALSTPVAGLFILHRTVVEASSGADLRGGIVLGHGSRIEGTLPVAGLVGFPAQDGPPADVAWRHDPGARRSLLSLAPRVLLAGWRVTLEP